ncbi:outer membrane biogenesis protein BamB [Gemmata sp. SH-PL17]|uniref:outer membrane protein assembly factor BamB family protein n=1 Tax=Gemmata sp. SH-PL17 TaxID=1630693 RepID=UPI0004BCA408|nr:PQQ-binding-like beta-propeller repeat protein [Gemmata sp. SH-PL17]AMV29664.1 outer membrane biogenesis protein BamB [Gemmata sp. SH-PL17]
MRTILALLGLAVAGTSATAADAWPSFRGTGDGAAKGDYPTQWSPKDGVAWKADLPGYGQSSPVVWGGTVYLTAVEGDQREKGFVVALDAKTGKEKWRHTFEPTQKAKWGFTISRAAPTPCVDADGLYCFFEGGNLIALTHAGKVRWERSLSKEYGEFQGGHGVGSSPAQTADAIYILIDHRGPSYLLAVDKATGKNKWKTEREQKGAWTSPVIATRDGKQEVIASSAGTVIGYAADMGKELWKLDNVVGNTLPSASVVGDRVLFGGGASRSKDDPPAGAKGNGCLKLVAKDGKPGFETAWTAKVGISNYATPLGYEGVAYFVNQVGVVYAHDLKTGKELFSERIDGACWASPLGAGKYVYFFGKDGTTSVLKAGSEFDLVASNKLWEPKPKPKAAAGAPEKKDTPGEYLDPIVYGVAAVDGAFFVRTGTQLFRVGK